MLCIKSSRKPPIIHHHNQNLTLVSNTLCEVQSLNRTQSLDQIATTQTRVFRSTHHTLSSMPSYTQSTSNTSPEKDAMSTRSVSTMASTKALLQSMLPSKRQKPAAKDKNTSTPADKTERDLLKAEALHNWALHR